MRPFPSSTPSVRSRAARAPRSPIMQAFFVLLLLLGGGWSAKASASIGGCDIQYNGTNFQQGTAGQTLTFNVDVTDQGYCDISGMTGTVTITSDGTIGAQLIAVPGFTVNSGGQSGTFTGGTNTYPFSVQLGSTVGNVNMTVVCTAGCSTGTTLNYTARLPADPEMTLSKVLTGNSDPDGSGTVTPGDVLTYTVTATNTGNIPLTGVIVTDPLTSPSSLNCASVAVGGSCILIGTYTVTAADALGRATISNTATAAAQQFCSLGRPIPKPGTLTAGGIKPAAFIAPSCVNNSTTVNTRVFPTPGMTVTKTLTRNTDGDGSGNVTVGDVLLYTVAANNTGRGALTNVTVNDPLTTPSSTTCSFVPSGGSCSLTGSYTVTATDLANGSISNTGNATATSIPGTTDSNTVVTTVHGSPRMTLTKVLSGNADGDGSGTVTLNDVLTYTVTATNTGNVTLTNVNLSDPLTSPSSNSCASVAPGATCTLSGSYTVTATDVANGTINNTAQAGANQFCPDGCNYIYASLSTKVFSHPAMTLTKVLSNNADNDGSGNVSPGDVLTYTVTATNTGDTTLDNVQVSDPLTTPNSFVCASVAVNATCVLSGAYTVTTTDAQRGSISNTGSAKSDQTANQNATLNTPVVSNPHLQVSKSLTANADADHSDTVTPGDVLTYTVTATNDGNVPLTNVQVSDPLTSPNATTCPNLGIGASCMLTGTYTVTSTDAENGSISNTGSATASQIATPVTSSLNTPVATLTHITGMSVVKVLSNNADNDGSGNVSVGDVLTFKVTATNGGNTTLTNVQVSDPLTTPNSTTCASVAPSTTCVLSGTYTVTATDASNGSISNTGSATASQVDGPVTSTINTAVAPLPSNNPAMTVVKQVTGNADNDNSGNVTVGDVLTYSVTATNTGDVALTNVHVTDLLTAPSTKTCPTLAIGATCVLSGTYTVTASDADGGSVNNEGSATATEIPSPVNTLLSTAIGSASTGMTITKVLTGNADGDHSGTVTVGDVLTFKVTATNTEDYPISNVQVTDPLTTPGSTTCATVAANASCVLTGAYTVTTTDASNGSIVNTGTASWLNGDGITNITSTLHTAVSNVANNPAMSVVKALTRVNGSSEWSGVHEGDVLTFTVTATNTGAILLRNVRVGDPLTTPKSQVCASMPVGGSCVLSGAYTVTASDASNGTISNTGSATTSVITTPVTSTIETAVEPTPTTHPAMSVVKALTLVNGENEWNQIHVGDVLTFTVTATNTGDVTLTNVHVTDPLTAPNSNTCASVAVNATCVLTGAYTVKASDASNGTISNTGSATASQITTAVTSTINTTVTPPPSNPAMSVVKALTHNADNDGSNSVTVGDVLTFTVTATNTGNVPLTNVQVSDPLTTPSSATCASVAVNATCVLTGTYTVTATDATNGSISNTGSATASQITTAVTSTINTTVTPPPSNPAMSVVKALTHNADNDGSNSVTVGDVLTYTVTATNTGNVPLTNVQVSDPLTTPSSVTCASVAVNATCVLTGAYTVTATDATNGSISNTGSAESNEIDDGVTSNTVVTNVAAAPNFQVAILSGDGQSGAPGQPLAQDFVVAVSPAVILAATSHTTTHALATTQSTSGPSGVPVTWTILSGGGSLSNGGSTVTDSNGHASNHLTLGNGTGQQQVQVCVPINSCVTFTVTSVQPIAALTIISGNGQSLVTNTQSAPLIVHLASNGSPVANATIHWNGSNATLAQATSVTDSNGDATNTAKVTNPGAATVTASSTAPSAGPVSFGMNGGFAGIPGLTHLQGEVAGALDAACTALASLPSLTAGQADLLKQCQNLAFTAGVDPDAAKHAFDQLFANIAFLQTSAALLIESTQFDNIKARIAALRSGTGHTHFGGLAFQSPDGSLQIGSLGESALGLADAPAKDKKDEVGGDFDRWGFFASGTFGWGSSDPRAVTPGFGFHTNGLTAGVDYRYNDHMIFGLAGGYAKYKADADAGLGGFDTTGWSVSAYTTLFKQDSWYMDGVFSWGNNNYDITRRIVFTTTTSTGTSTVDQTATGSSGGTTIAGALTFGRDFTKGAWSYGPYFRGTWTKVSFDDFRETLNPGNGSGIGLVVKTGDLKSVASVLGAKVNYVKSTSWGVLMPHAEVEWNHEFHDNPDSVTARFLNDPTQTPISVSGDPTDTDYFRLGIGLSFVLPKGRSGFIYYEKTLGRTGITQDNLAIGIRLEF